MLTRLFKFAVARGIGGPGRSWVYASGFMTLLRFAIRATGRRGVSERLSTKPGDTIVIEHLEITHKQQMKQIRAQKKADKQYKKHQVAQAKQFKKDVRRARKG